MGGSSKESGKNNFQAGVERGPIEHWDRVPGKHRRNNRAMKRPMWLAAVLLTLLSAAPVRADNRFIVRSTLRSSALTQLCLLQTCTVLRAIHGTLNQVFLLTAPSLIDPTTLLTLLRNTPGIVNAELDQVINLFGGLNAATTPPTPLPDSTALNYSA